MPNSVVYLLLIIGVLCTVGAYLNEAMGKSQRMLLARSWEAVAKKVGGTFHNAKGKLATGESMQIAATITGIQIRADYFLVSGAQEGSPPRTRIRASAGGAHQLNVKISEGRARDCEPVRFGDAAFEHAFFVVANDEDMTRAWVDAQTRAKILALKGYDFEIDNGTATATHIGIEDNRERFVAAIDALVSLAAGGRALYARWSQIATLLEGSIAATPAGMLISTKRGRVTIAIATLAEPLGSAGETMTRTRIRAPVVAKSSEVFDILPGRAMSEDGDRTSVPFDDAFAAVFRVRSNWPQKTQKRLREELRAKLLAIDPVSVRLDQDNATIVLPGVEMKPEKLTAACEVVEELAEDPRLAVPQ
jgi:hypothetical protein